jgi:hypothetical protein
MPHPLPARRDGKCRAGCPVQQNLFNDFPRLERNSLGCVSGCGAYLHRLVGQVLQ